MPEQPPARTVDDVISAVVCGHDFVVGQTVAVIGRVVRVWPHDPELPPAFQVRFTNLVENGGSYVAVPASIVRSEPEPPDGR
jgi:hypothetical protein